MATGMTLHSLARATGSEILENGPDLGMVNHSPNMSPNLPAAHNMHQGDGHYLEDRKQPQPIGTERARKVYTNVDSTGCWMFGNDTKPPARWANNDHYNLGRGQVYSEEMQYVDAFAVSEIFVIATYLEFFMYILHTYNGYNNNRNRK